VNKKKKELSQIHSQAKNILFGKIQLNCLFINGSVKWFKQFPQLFFIAGAIQLFQTWP
jgi:hypothetical protein